MPDQPSPPPAFHEGCYCFREAEAEIARAQGQPVLCGGGQPCACMDPVAPPYDVMWDNVLSDVLPAPPQQRGGKRPRSQCASCSCACAILHAAAAAVTAAAAKIRRCCGGDCRCPPGLCRCPQEAVPVDTYACGALNEVVSQRITTALQMEPPPSSDVSATLQALQPPPTMTSIDITSALNAALHGLPATQVQQSVPVQPQSRAACCASSDGPSSQRQPQIAQVDLSQGIHVLPALPRSCCGAAASKPLISSDDLQAPAPMARPAFENTVPLQTSPKTGCCTSSDITTQRQPQLPQDDFSQTIQALPTVPRSCCGGAPAKAAVPNGDPSTSAGMTTTELENAVQGLPTLLQSRHSGCCGRGISQAPVVQTSMPQVATTAHLNGEASRQSEMTIPATSLSTRAKSFPDSAPSSRSEPAQRPNERDRVFACHLCDSSFKFKQNRDRHINEVHRGLRPHECDYQGCESAFKNLSGLKQHKKTVHEKARPFKCRLCDRAFGQRNHLSQHILVVHEKVKQYACNYCDMSFSNVGNRTQHTKRKHPNMLLRKENELRQLNESTT